MSASPTAVVVFRTIVRSVVITSERISKSIRNLSWKARLGKFGTGANIYPRAAIYSPRQVRIGNRVTINDFVHIRGAGGVIIEDEALIAPSVVITSESHDIEAARLGLCYRETSTRGPVHIGRNVWVGAGAIILPNVKIGEGSMIAAGAIVIRDVAPRTLVAGVPAKVVRELGN